MLNHAYKLQHTGGNYESDSGIVNDLTYQYNKYKNMGSAYTPVQQPANPAGPAPQSKPAVSGGSVPQPPTIPPSVSNIPQAPTDEPTVTETTTQGEKANKTHVAPVDPPIQRPVQNTVKLPDMGDKYRNKTLRLRADRIAKVRHLLSQKYYRNVNRALMAGSN